MSRYKTSSIILISAPLLLLLSGCGPRIINWDNPQEAASRIEIKHDPFQKVTTITGPNCASNPQEDALMLRAWRLDSGRTEIQIYVSDEYTYEIMRSGVGWRFYTLAHDSEGHELPVVQISRAVNWCGRYKCSYLEVVGVTITREYLVAHEATGIILKISGKGGEYIVTIPGPYIQAFLKQTT